MDTCAFLDLSSCHDLIKSVNQPELQHQSRISRQGHALRLAIWFHETGATTLSYLEELMRIQMARVPPGVASLERNYVSLYTHFTKDYLLPGWKSSAAFGLPKDLNGDDVDVALVDLAAELGIPVITNEGYGHGGDVDRKRTIHAHAATKRVRVMQAAEFYKAHLKRSMVESFLWRFDRLAPVYVGNDANSEAKANAVRDLAKFYTQVLNHTVDEVS